MREEFSYNIILLGGTGAKCGEILLHMCANGYFPYAKLNMLYIDSDTGNGNARTFRNLYDTYVKCRESYLIPGTQIDCFFHTKVKLKTQNPVRKYTYFSDLAKFSGKQQGTTEAAEALMGVLYSEEEMSLKISDGFFAHPNVGAAVFAANMESIMAEFLEDIRKDAREMRKIKIFLLGSVFGGTGASSLPTIARYFKESPFGSSDNKNIREQLKIGGCLVLPYFSFDSENMEQKKKNNATQPQIEPNKFSLKTKSALEYYKYVDAEEGRKTFNELFILGHDRSDVRGYYAASGEEQRNLPHVVEFYSAMSAVTFFEEDMEKEGYFFAVTPARIIGGENIYKGTKGYSLFMFMMRFALVMKSLIMEELFDYTKKNKLKENADKIPWYYDFLCGKADAKDFEADRLYSKFHDISDYCDAYIRWFAELNLSNIAKLDKLEQIDYRPESGDTVSYLSFFSKQLLFRQLQNIQIWNADEGEKNDLYADNLKYIRTKLQELETVHFYTDRKSERIGMGEIWSRLSYMGFNSFLKNDDVFKNIFKSTDKTMDSGVRNLVNAIFCACLF